jgi:hypothetical protein
MPRNNLNYYLYRSLHKGSSTLKSAIPSVLIPRDRQLSKRLTLAVTTYIERYDDYFKPLYLKLSKLFGDTQIIVAVNGYGDTNAQAKYLQRIENELCSNAPATHRFILHDEPVGLSRMWNEILLHSKATSTLILNDDLTISPWFRRWVDRHFWAEHSLTLLNNSWSHFAISRQLIDKIGAFDPGFAGIGFEDMDFDARVHFAKQITNSLECPYIHHLNHTPKTTSFDQISGRTWGKYTSQNEAYFFSKWQQSLEPEDAYIRQLKSRVKPRFPHNLPRLEDQALTGLVSATIHYPERMKSRSSQWIQ